MRLFLLPLLAILLICTPCFAGPPSPTEPDLAQELKLSKEQQAKLQAVHEKYATQKATLRQNVAERRSELAAQMNSESPNRGAIEKSLQDIVALEGRRQKLVVDEYFEVMQILTPDQRKLFRSRVVKQIVR